MNTTLDSCPRSQTTDNITMHTDIVVAKVYGATLSNGPSRRIITIIDTYTINEARKIMLFKDSETLCLTVEFNGKMKP